MMMVVMIIEYLVIEFNGEDSVDSVDGSNGATHDVNHRIATERHNGNIFMQTKKKYMAMAAFRIKKYQNLALATFTILLQYYYNTFTILLQYFYNTFTIILQYFYNTNISKYLKIHYRHCWQC